MRRARVLFAVAVAVLGVSLSRASLATNACDETVASTRMVDGIPAYAQCTATTSSAIYSNNGVDTATASGGTGWVRTQMSGGYQCTELAHRYLYFKWNVQSVPNGNAGTWCDGTIPTGLVKATTPVHGDLIVFAPGSCGADPTTGHVAVVDVVNANATVTFVEQNSPGRRSCANSTAACFLHAVANDGSALDGGAPDSSTGDAGTIGDVHSVGDLAADRYRPDLLGTGGAPGRGGAPGAGGASETGGAVGAGGASPMGGALGVGGMSGVGGTTTEPAGTAGSTSPEPSSGSSNGCSCRLHDKGSSTRSTVILLVLASLLAARRRRG